MNTILEGFGWLTTADNWWGSNGIAEALREHLWYSLLALLGAAAIGLPVGLAIGHTGRGRYVAANPQKRQDIAKDETWIDLRSDPRFVTLFGKPGGN